MRDVYSVDSILAADQVLHFLRHDTVVYRFFSSSQSDLLSLSSSSPGFPIADGGSDSKYDRGQVFCS